MSIKPVRTRQAYEEALKMVGGLMNAKAGSPDGDRLDVLVTLIQAFEVREYSCLSDPLTPPTLLVCLAESTSHKGLEST